MERDVEKPPYQTPLLHKLEAVKSSASWMKPERDDCITDADVEALIGSIQSRHPNLTPDQLAKIKAHLLSSVGTAKENLSEVQQQAEQEASTASSENTAQPSSLQEAEKQFVRDMHAYDNYSSAKRSELEAAGYGNKDNRKKLETLRLEMAKCPEGSSQWNEVHSQMLTLDKDYFEQVEKQAHTDGNSQIESKAHAGAHEAQKHYSEVRGLIIGKQLAAEMAAEQAAVKRQIPDDETIKASNKNTTPIVISPNQPALSDLGDMKSPPGASAPKRTRDNGIS